MRAVAESSLQHWFDELPGALRRSDEAGKAHALKIITCLETCPPQWIASHLLATSAHVERLVNVLVECFALDADSAGLLLVAVPEGGGAFQRSALSSTPLNDKEEEEEHSREGDNNGETENIDHHLGQSKASDAASQASQVINTDSVAMNLPRMPLGLLLIATQKTYRAVAGVVRTLAAVAAAASAHPERGTPGIALRSLVDGCLQQIEQLKESEKEKEGSMSSNVSSKNRRRKGQGPGAGIKKKDKHSTTQHAQHGSSIDGLSIPWQISAAQTVIVLTEVLFGASPEFNKFSSYLRINPQSLSSPSMISPNKATTSTTSNTSTGELEALVALALPLIVDEQIWGLPTAIDTSFALSSLELDTRSSGSWDGYSSMDVSSRQALLPSSTPGYTIKDRGCNALLQRACLDCVGSAARALGPKFSTHGRLMRSVLLPTLEKIGDPCQLVSSAAESATQALCFYGKYEKRGGSLRQLVAENADYIVDGLCRQLRQPETYPRAPYLFAALLRQGGVAPGLVPLLAEPARQALTGISIVARRRRPEHVLSFVMCLRQIAQGAGSVAQEASLEIERLLAVVRERQEALEIAFQDEKERKFTAAAGVTAETGKTVHNKPNDDLVIGAIEDITEEEESGRKAPQGGLAGTNIDEIKDYFAERLAQKEEEDTNTQGESDSQEERKVQLTLNEWNEIQVARRKAASCGTLAQSTADTAGPLALSSSLPVAIQAMKACIEALQSLSTATKAVELYSKAIEPRVIPPGGVLSPSESTPATLLPSVHLLWSPLLGALSDWRIAVVESALGVLSNLATLAGNFLTRRFEKEAWPIMKRILREGPSQQRIIAPGQDNLSSPAVVQRAQRAVLVCLRHLAQGEEEGPVAVVTPVAAQGIQAAAELLGDGQAPVVRESATAAFIALAGVDPDAAWALLVASLRSVLPTAAAVSKVVVGEEEKTATHVKHSAPAAGLENADKKELVPPSYLGGIQGYSNLPDFAALCPMPPGNFLPKGLRTCGEGKLQALMREISEMSVPWHNSVIRLSKGY